MQYSNKVRLPSHSPSKDDVTIAESVERFLSQNAGITTIEGVLTVRLPDALEAAAQKKVKECQDILHVLADKTATKALTDLYISDANFKKARGVLAFLRKYDDDEVIALTDRLDIHMKEYKEIVDGRAFILEELLPALQRLRQGINPQMKDTKILLRAREEIGRAMEDYLNDSLPIEVAAEVDRSFLNLHQKVVMQIFNSPRINDKPGIIQL